MVKLDVYAEIPIVRKVVKLKLKRIVVLLSKVSALVVRLCDELLRRDKFNTQKLIYGLKSAININKNILKTSTDPIKRHLPSKQFACLLCFLMRGTEASA